VRRGVTGEHANDDPSEPLQILEPVNVFGVLHAVGAVMIPVVLDRDFDVLPAHVEVVGGPTVGTANGDLRTRPREPSLDEDQPQQRLHLVHRDSGRTQQRVHPSDSRPGRVTPSDVERRTLRRGNGQAAQQHSLARVYL